MEVCLYRLRRRRPLRVPGTRHYSDEIFAGNPKIEMVGTLFIRLRLVPRLDALHAVFRASPEEQDARLMHWFSSFIGDETGKSTGSRKTKYQVPRVQARPHHNRGGKKPVVRIIKTEPSVVARCRHQVVLAFCQPGKGKPSIASSDDGCKGIVGMGNVGDRYLPLWNGTPAELIHQDA